MKTFLKLSFYCGVMSLHASEMVELAPTVLMATRVEATVEDQPYALYTTPDDILNERVGRSTLDRFNYGPGVFIQRTAPAQASPFIRGLTGEQTLLLLDGVRLSHATMRPGPNQYSAMLPEGTVDRIDSILGPSSIVNGSDGLTGAVDFRLREAGRGETRTAVPWVKTLLDIANGQVVSAGVDGRLETSNLSYSIDLNGQDFHDRKAGDGASKHLNGVDDDTVPNTAYEQWSSSARLRWDGTGKVLDLALGHTRQLDAPRPDGYAANSGKVSRISRSFDPQSFSFVHLKSDVEMDVSWLDHLHTKVYWHRHNEEQTREDLTSSTYRLRELDNAIDQIGLDVEARSSWTDVFSLTWGAMIQIEKTDNGYREFRSPDGSEDPSLSVAYGQADWENKTTISDGAKYETKSIFTQLSIDPSGPWSSLVGLRFSRYDWSFGDVDGDTSDFTWSLRTVRDLSETQNIFVGVSKAFRAPNLTNLDGAVDRGSSGQFAFGNPDLDPEVSLTIEGGWRYANDDFKVMLTIFDTQVEDLIQDVGTGSFDNLEDAHLWGAESRVTWSPNLGGQKRLSFFNDVSLVRGRIDVPQADGSIMRDNISRANRVYGRSGARYVLGHGAVSLQCRWHDAYDHVATSDAGDVRLTIPGDDRGALPGYAVLDLRFERALGHRKSIACGLENILDKNYREPGSGVDGPGRNAFLQLAWSW